MDIQAVIFDFGNVISRFDNNKFYSWISAQTDKDAHEVRDIIKGGLQELYEKGLISSQEFHQDVCEHTGLKATQKDFRHAYSSIFTPIPETLDLIDRLRGSYILGLLSNTSEWHYVDHIQPLVEDRFDTVTTSFVAGALKPDPHIYQDALNKLDMPPEHCVFIDDIEGNAEAAAELGINGIHYRNPEQLETALRHYHISLHK